MKCNECGCFNGRHTKGCNQEKTRELAIGQKMLFKAMYAGFITKPIWYKERIKKLEEIIES